MPFWHEFRPTKHFSSFSAKTHPIHYVRSKTHVLCGFAPFGCRKHTFAKFILGCRIGTSLGRRNYCRLFQPKRIQSTNLGPKLTFWVVSHHLVATSAPLRNRVQGCRFGTSLGQRNFFQDFLPKRIQSTTLDPKHMFWVVLHHLVAASAAFPNRVLVCFFGTSLGWPDYCRVFLAKMHPIHYFRSKTHILGGFTPFFCCMCTVAKSVPKMLFWHEFRPTKLFLSFSAKMHPIHHVRSKTHVLCGFGPFGCHKWTFAKWGPSMPFWHEFGPTKLLTSFLAKTHPIH